MSSQFYFSCDLGMLNASVSPEVVIMINSCLGCQESVQLQNW